MARRKSKSVRKYTVRFSFKPRLLCEHLGGRKYSRSIKAIAELVANGFDAGASRVEVKITYNELGVADGIVIWDNGHGISPDALKRRFLVVGVEPLQSDTAACFSRLGVGRLAVYRIGRLSRWISVSGDGAERIRVTFALDSEQPETLKVTEEQVSPDTASGTTIEVSDLRDTGVGTLNPSGIAAELKSQFCSYLLGTSNREIIVQDEVLRVEILSQEEETIPPSSDMPEEARLKHLILVESIERARLCAPVLFCAKGRTVATAVPDDPPPANYLGIVECPHLDSLVTANREDLLEMDAGFAGLRSAALERVHGFGVKYRAGAKRHFIEVARAQDFYPFKNAVDDPIVSVQQDVYDVILEKVHEKINLGAMAKRQQAIVFRLLQRSLDNDDILQVVQHLLDLDDAEVETFRKVLEHTRLGSIVKLASEVTNRLTFLEILHKLTYGEIAGAVKERSQLHRIVEPHCWLFGQQFHLASSDKGFRTVIAEHRKRAGLGTVNEDELALVKGINDIPDLFLAAERDYTTEPRHHRVLVEIKAPRVPLGAKERDQIRKYAGTISESAQFDKTSSRWDLFLVSSKATDEIDMERKQKGKPFGCLWEWDNMTVWAFQWSELIQRAKDEMHLIREHLKATSKELSVSEYLRENFPEVLGELSKKMAGVGAGGSSSPCT